jgi:hypothetical protein
MGDFFLCGNVIHGFLLQAIKAKLQKEKSLRTILKSFGPNPRLKP